MTEQIPPGHKALRRGRYSQPNARYFITLCTVERDPWLYADGIPEAVFDQLREKENGFELIASVVMPDHLHLLIELVTGDLTRAIQVFKSRSAIAINKQLNRSGAVWQPAFFDRKLRNDDEVAPVLSYMWNNPKQPGMYFRCRNAEWLWFKSMVTQDISYPEWLSKNPVGE
jgi:putative transposase